MEGLGKFRHYKSYNLTIQNILLHFIMFLLISLTFRIFFPPLPSACGWSFLLTFVSFLLWCWFTSTICCFAIVYIWKESFCTSKCYTQILALKAGKGGKWKSVSSGQVFRCWQLKARWQASDSLSFSSGKMQNPCLLLVIFPISCISQPNNSPGHILWLKEYLPAATDIHVNKENKYFLASNLLWEIKESHMFIKWTQRALTHTWVILGSV